MYLKLIVMNQVNKVCAEDIASVLGTICKKQQEGAG